MNSLLSGVIAAALGYLRRSSLAAVSNTRNER